MADELLVQSIVFATLDVARAKDVNHKIRMLLKTSNGKDIEYTTCGILPYRHLRHLCRVKRDIEWTAGPPNFELIDNYIEMTKKIQDMIDIICSNTIPGIYDVSKAISPMFVVDSNGILGITKPIFENFAFNTNRYNESNERHTYEEAIRIMYDEISSYEAAKEPRQE